MTKNSNQQHEQQRFVENTGRPYIPLSWKQNILFGILLIINFSAAFFAYRSSTRGMKEIASTKETRIPTALYSKNAQINLHEVSSNLLGYLVAGQPQYIEGFRITNARFKYNLHAMKGGSDAHILDLADEVDSIYSKLEPLMLELFNLRSDPLGNRLPLREYREVAEPLLHTIQEISPSLYEGNARQQARAQLKTLQELSVFMENVAAVNPELNDRARYSELLRENTRCWLALVKKQGKSSQDRQIIHAIATKRMQLLASFERIFYLYESGRINEDNHLFRTRVAPEFSRMFSLLNSIADESRSILNNELDLSAQALGNTHKTLFVNVFLAIIIVLSLFVLFSRMVTRPIMELIKGTKKISDGDLSTRVQQYANDELGLLAEAFNNMGETLQMNRRKLEQNISAITEAKEAAEKANQAKSSFLANMSHEIRTPMNAVLGFAEILKEMVQEPQKSDYINKILSSGKALLTLINDILDLSKIESGKMELHYSVVSVGRLFEEMKILFETKAHSKLVELIIDENPSIPEALVLDETRLRQILVNVVSNAVKYTNHGSVHLTASASNETELKSCVDLRIAVEDTGVGIPPEKLDSIFLAFEQVSSKDAAQYGGTGLGLAITQRITELMGGSVTVESELGRGSKFTIHLPEVEIAAVDALQAENVRILNFDSIQFEAGTLLIVDDVDYNREILSTYVVSFGFQLLFAGDGCEAIEQAKSGKPDLILLDMKMPNMNGYETVDFLKKDAVLNKIPVIAVTASALKQDEDIISELCDGYLRKPVSKSELVHEIMKFLPYRIDEVEIEEAQVNNPSLEYTQKMLLEELVKLPDNWRKEALHLASIGSVDELDRYIDEIQDSHPLVANTIRRQTASYSFNLVIDLLQGK